MRIEPSFRPAAGARASARFETREAPEAGPLDRLLATVLGLIFACAAALLALALLSWTATDHSFATQSLEPARNWLGTRGALVADALMRSLGLAAVFLVLPLAVWAGDAFSGRSLVGLKLRAVLAPVAVVCLAAAFSSGPTFRSWPLQMGLGGTIGDLFADLVTRTLAPVAAGWSGSLTALIATVAGLVCLLVALDRTWADVVAIVRTPARMHLPDSSWVRGHLARVREEVAVEPAPPAVAPAAVAPVVAPAAGEPIAPLMPREMRALEAPQPVAEPAPVMAESERRHWQLPSPTLLPRGGVSTTPPAAHAALERLKVEQLASALATFSVRADVTIAASGPLLTTLHVEPAAGIKPARILGLADDLARLLQVASLRLTPLPGRATVAVEVPQTEPMGIELGDLVGSDAYTACKGAMPWAIGAGARGEAVIASLNDIGPALIAGGDAELRGGMLRALAGSLLSRSTPDELRLLVIDGPGTPFAALSGLPHLDHHPARSPAAAGLALTAAQRALDARRMTAGSLPPLVFMIADIAALADVPGLADTLSDISRCGPALGVHLIAATSSAEAPLTAEAARGLFQTLFVGRTASKVDSRRWMAATGAEDLLPARDVLIATRSDALRRLSGGGELPRVHPVTLDGTALERVVAAVMTPKPAHAVAARVASPVLTTRHPQPTAPAFAAKPLRAGPIPATIYDRALPLVMQFAAIDADLLTQRLGIAYPQALDVLVQLQADRLVTAPDQNGECRVLVGRTA